MTTPVQAAYGGAQAMPPTRYQGSKRKLARAIVDQLRSLSFDSVLDAFGGTGSVAYAFKRAGYAVTYNDLLASNHQIGLALIENDTVRLPEGAITEIGARRHDRSYGDFIERTFSGIYYTDEENRWLDTAVANIRAIRGRYQRSIAWYALFQAAMAKRPYNLFHRRNLYMRTADVERGFGNKATWDRSFNEHYRACAEQANAAVFESGGRCRATCRDALEIEPRFDLVYIDTPYISRSGVGVDYHHFYHLLEGMMAYDDWAELIDYRSKHRRLQRRDDPWTDPRRVHDRFRHLFDRFRESILVVSYRSDGIPSIPELRMMLKDLKRQVWVIHGPAYQYVLSTNRKNREVLLIGID